MSTEAVFQVSGVTFAYPGFPPCLCAVDLEVAPGERVAVLGANGSGKSTLLHLLDGLHFAQSGRVRAFGQVLEERLLETSPFGSRFRAQVGYLFQNSEAMLFCPTVAEELAFGPLQLGLPAAEVRTRIADALALLEIGHLQDRPPAALSAGEKKRVALASLLTLSPSVLLLDEPTAGLDPRSQGLLLDLLAGLHASGLTLVTATHDLDLLPELAERVVVLGEDHRVAAEGPVKDILADGPLLLRANLVRSAR